MANDKLTSWRKSSYSDANGECVEVAADRRVVGVRDTKQHGDGVTLKFSASAWRTLIDEAKSW